MHFNIYSKGEDDLTNGYIQIKQRHGNLKWNNETEALAATISTYADSVIPCTFDVTTHSIEVTIPAALPSGVYDVIVKAGETPADTDIPLDSGWIDWKQDTAACTYQFVYRANTLLGRSVNGV